MRISLLAIVLGAALMVSGEGKLQVGSHSLLSLPLVSDRSSRSSRSDWRQVPA